MPGDLRATLTAQLAALHVSDGHRPHQEPQGLPAETVAWRCQACGEWIRETGEPANWTNCAVDWRTHTLGERIAADVLALPLVAALLELAEADRGMVAAISSRDGQAVNAAGHRRILARHRIEEVLTW